MDHKDKLRELRSWGIPLSDIAEMLDYSPRTVEGWLQGRPMSRHAKKDIERLAVDLLQDGNGDLNREKDREK